MEKIVDAQVGKLNHELYYNAHMSEIRKVSRFFKTSGKDSKQIVKIKVIIDEDPQFINLFGVNIDLNTGNIALGLYVLKSEYICIGNIKKTLTDTWFNKDKSIVSKIDIKYILELLKLDPLYYQKEIYEDIMYQLTNQTISNSSSLSSYYVKVKNVGNLSKSVEYFNKLYKSGELIPSLAKVLINAYLDAQDLAEGFYYNFITEQYDDDITNNYNKTFKGIFESRNNPYVEALTIRYLEYGFPVSFLNALKSYGHFIKERKSIFNTYSKVDLTGYYGKELVDIGIALSSGYYARKVEKKEIILAYNFMDLLSACGWEQNLLVSLDIIVEQRNLNVWKALLNKFNIYDILKEQNLVEKDFVLGIDTYRNEKLIHIDTGTCYKRTPCMSQYRMVSFSPYQIGKAGEVVEEAFDILLKGMKF